MVQRTPASNAIGPEPSERELLMALVALLVEEREVTRAPGEGRPRTELLLHAVGLGNVTIGRVMNKHPDAVRMVIARASTPPKKQTQRPKS